jgi:hypothetical protein
MQLKFGPSVGGLLQESLGFLTIQGLVFVIVRYRSEPNKFAWVIGLLFVFCPIPTAMVSLHLIVAIKGFELLS